MRLYLTLSKNKEPVPFDNQVNLTGALHKWMGFNREHGNLSLYSLSWLQGGQRDGAGLSYPKGAEWFISAYNEGLIKQILKGIMVDPEVAFGMCVVEVTLRETPYFNSVAYFRVGSPVFVKRTFDDVQKHYTYSDIEADMLLTETLQSKLKKAGLETQNVKVQFDHKYAGAKSKLSRYRGIGNKVNYCPVIIEGSPGQIAFAWDVGVGNSTGIGYGSLI